MSKHALHRSVARRAFCSLLPIALLAAPTPALAAKAPIDERIHAELVEEAKGDLKAFYANSERPIWYSQSGTLKPAAHMLLRLVQTAEYDGLDPQSLGLAKLEET